MKKEIAKIKRLMRQASAKYNAYENLIGQVDKLLVDNVDFQCAVVRQPGDGFCLLDEEDGIKLAPLWDCLEVISKKGKLTKEDLRSLLI